MRVEHSLEPHPAPGDLELVQAFVNTHDPHAGIDRLESPVGLADFLARRQLLPAGGTVDEETWRSALAAREGLRALFLSRNGARLDVAAFEELNRVLAAAPLHTRLELDGRPRLESPNGGWPAAVARMLDAIVDATRDGRWQRLKACHEPSCRMVFYDGSRNRLGKWCNRRRCGNRINTRTYRDRRPRYRLS